MASQPRGDLRTVLAVVRRRWMTLVSLRALTRVGAGGLLVLLALVATDLVGRSSDPVMVALVGVTALGAVWWTVRSLRPLRRVPSDRQVARYLEERCPGLEDRVASAADVVARDGRSVVDRLVVNDAVTRVRDVDLRGVVPRARVRAAAIRAVATTALLVTLGGASVERLVRLAGVAWLYAVPSSASLEVQPGVARVMVGESLRITARVDGSLAAPDRTSPMLRVDRDGVVETFTMERARDGFELVVPDVRDDFTYDVSLAALQSPPFAVTTLRPPRVERIDVTYAYPERANLPPRVERDGGDVRAPAGTRVTVEIHFDKAVRAGVLSRSDHGDLPLRAGDDRMLRAAFDVVTDETYRVSALDMDGISMPPGAEYFIRAVRDRPPVVEVTRPGGDREVTALEEVVVEATAEDDFGLDRFELRYAVAGEAERVVTLLADPTMRMVSGAHTLFVEDMDVMPGDLLTYYVMARDTDTGSGARDTRSDIYFLEVRPFDREFEEAQSDSATATPPSDIGRLVEVQKQIVAATWKLDVRPASDRAAADVETVADAQEDLRWAVQREAQQIFTRGFSAGSGAGASPSDEMTAMRSAIEAMEEAVEWLRDGDTTDAIPPEMEALRQLRRAETQTRRQQVARNRNQGSSSGGSAREDLSALFDRDLRRDQRTNYEDRSSAQPEPEPASDDGDLQRRLRELAERQEAITRDQERLAGEEDRLDEDERRRELERLTREQEELRRQLEQIARQRGEAGGTREATGSAGERMRETGRALRRGETAEAAEQSRQASRELRELERRLAAETESEPGLEASRDAARELAEAYRALSAAIRGDGADPEARADQAQRGDELAEEERRLERRLEQMDPQGEAASDALSEARDELRGTEAQARARALSEDLRRMARSTSGSGGQPGSEPDSAVPRSPSGRGGDDATEQERVAESGDELADSLERVARSLAGAAVGSEAERLSEALRRVQELRARLEPSEDAAQPGGAAGGVDDPRRLARDLAQTPGLMEQLSRVRPGGPQDLDAWARHWQSGPSPGTEAFKADLADWDSLRRDVRLALEAVEAQIASARRAAATTGRSATGPSEDVPESYRRVVDRYYRSIANAGSRR